MLLSSCQLVDANPNDNDDTNQQDRDSAQWAQHFDVGAFDIARAHEVELPRQALRTQIVTVAGVARKVLPSKAHVSTARHEYRWIVGEVFCPKW